jgi:hypothetical protein
MDAVHHEVTRAAVLGPPHSGVESAGPLVPGQHPERGRGEPAPGQGPDGAPVQDPVGQREAGQEGGRQQVPVRRPVRGEVQPCDLGHVIGTSHPDELSWQ